MAKDQRFNLMMSEEDAKMLRALADAERESAATVVRQLVRRAYAEKFPKKPKR